MRSQLTDANITNIDGNPWIAEYIYHDNGDMASRTITGTAKTDFTYTGNLMDTAGGGESFDLDWDDNGNMIIGVDANLVYNWDDKLRSADSDGNEIALKYDPSGNRIYKNSSDAGQRKYIIDIVGDLPVILLELDVNNVIQKTYIYANSQIVSQHDGSHTASRYFYLHDRLGSVRQVIDTSGDVKNVYVYEPFGKLFATETTEDVTNSFKFTGQFFDSEIDEYHLRARQYDPHIGRFTSRDPVFGKFKEPMTLHAYLYCQNEPIGRIDPWGLLYKIAGAGMHYNLAETQKVMDAFLDLYERYGFIIGSFKAFYTTVEGQEIHIERLFGHPFFGEFDYKGKGYTFTLEPYTDPVKDSEFGNYLAGFAGYYYWGGTGVQIMTMAGDWYSEVESGGPDELDSRRWIGRGILGANLKQKEEGGRGFMGQRDEVLVRSIPWNMNIMNFERDWSLGRSFYYAW